MRRRAFVFLLGTLSVAACVAPEPELYPPPRYPASPPVYAPPTGRLPAGPGSGQVAILLPLSGANAELGHAMLNAARLALDVPGAPGLDVRDTAGTPAGAEQAAEQAIAAGDRIILGPLTAVETQAAAGPASAAGVPVLAFTSDPAEARPGVWTLGLTPGQQVRRLVGAAVARGRTHFAALLPDNDFGRLMQSALVEAAQAAGVPPPQIRQYASTPEAMNEQARELAPPFDALLLAAAGPRLGELASVLEQGDVTPAKVQILGPALWAQPAARGPGGKLLEGAWYAAPDAPARAPFVAQYRAKYGAPPPRLADLAYDAAAIARLDHQRGYAPGLLTRRDGFAGADGLLALSPDGQVRRALGLFEIRNGGTRMIEPPPPRLRGPGV